MPIIILLTRAANKQLTNLFTMFKVVSITPAVSAKGLEYKELRLQAFEVNPLVASLGVDVVKEMGIDLTVDTAENCTLACFPAGEFEGRKIPESLHYNAKIGTVLLGEIVNFKTTDYQSKNGTTVNGKKVFVEKGKDAIVEGLKQLAYVGASIITEDGEVHMQPTSQKASSTTNTFAAPAEITAADLVEN